MAPEPDFSGYVTRYGVRCADGRVIKPGAFRDNDGQTVPLVWHHQHDSVENVLGHVILHARDDGTYGEGFFNDTQAGRQAKALVMHKDIRNLSIYANQLIQQAMDVVHGMIREVSMVLSGANPGAFIDFVNLEHSLDGTDDEAIFYTDEEIVLAHSAAPAATMPPTKPALADMAAAVPATSTGSAAPVVHAVDVSAALPAAQSAAGASKPRTVQDVIDSMNEEQQQVLFALVGEASAQQSAPPPDPATSITGSEPDPQKGDAQVTRNVFDQNQDGGQAQPGGILTHSDLQQIFADANKKGSLRDAVEEWALAHSITNIDLMFPDAKAVTDTPDWVSRRQEWVAGVLGNTRHTPFSRIKSMTADITLDEARARGYVKGALKREEFFAVAKRVTTPQTIYKKQRLDRDDIVDITDFDVVAWLKAEMRLMLDEEVARAVLIGDGRDVADPDKINEANVRPILTDADLYVTQVNIDDSFIPPTASQTYEYIIDQVVTAMQYYMGTGVPVFYGPRSWITKMLLTKDTLGRRLHSTVTELADAMGVAGIVPVDVMETMAGSVVGIIVNLADYTIGADRGGEVNFFDDFDIDYNRYTYLYETRLSGALTRFKSAIVVKLFTGAGGPLADPAAPTFVKSTGVVTVVDHTTDHYTYVTVAADGTETAVGSYGAQTAIAAGASVHYRAKAASTYTFANNAKCDWTFQRPAS